MDTTTIDPINSNSFYYFFSAVPQVLAGVLALFGFFLVFKIQSLKDDLIVKATNVLNYLRTIHYENDTDEIIIQRSNVIDSLVNQIKTKNINDLYLFVLTSAADDPKTKVNKSWIQLTNQYSDTYDMHQKLKNQTLRSSFLTIFIILECLVAIPFGKYFLSNPHLLEGLFVITLSLIAMCFITFGVILYYALSDKSTLT